MPRTTDTPVPSSRWSRSAAAVTAVGSLLLLAACGGGASSGAEDGSTASAAEADTAPAAHAHEEGGEAHSHGDGAHTHAPADTLAADVALSPGEAADWSGSATLLSIGDSVRVLVSVAGMSPGARHPVELVAGSCEQPGPVLADLTPLATGSSGAGSSQTEFASSRLEGHAHGGLRLLGSDGATVACAPVHLSGSDHGHAE